MRTQLIIGGLLASVALFPAIAQPQPSPSAQTAPTLSKPAPVQRMDTTTTTTTMAAPRAASGQWRASKLVGVDVYNNANEKIGDISEILLDTSGKVTGVIIGVGGFLGMGQHDVLVQMDQLKFVNEARPTAASTTTTTTSTTTGAATSTRPVRVSTEKWYPDHAVMNATKDQLKGMTAFKYN